MTSSFGRQFSVTTFGESHGRSVGVVIDGVPAGLALDIGFIQAQLDRRRPGQSKLTSPRSEADRIEIHSGVEDGVTLGSPIMLMVQNADQRPADYEDLSGVFRPSHADFTTMAKFGVKAKSGGGRSSARETIGRVAAGAIAEQLLNKVLPGFSIVAWVDSVGAVSAQNLDDKIIDRSQVDAWDVRCPDPKAAEAMTALIESAKQDGDSVGGTIRCLIRGVPAGLGEPVFDKLEADLAKAMLSLPATKGFEIGSGFAGTLLKGSEHNDPFEVQDGRVGTATNHSGGVQGGISNGALIVFRVAFKPVATIAKPQKTVTTTGESTVLQPKKGRHDPCVLPRAVPMVEAMATLVIADHWLRSLDDRLP